MELNQVMDELRAYVRKTFEVPPDDSEFTDDVHLFDYGYIDSFGAVDLTTFVQERFEIKVSDSDLIVHPMNTLREISEFVLQRADGAI